jgi:hypothetical protein
MRISLPGSAGVTFSQLKPVGTASLYYNAGGILNHSETVRDSYTVPPGKFAVVEYVFVRVRFNTGQNELWRISARVKVAYGGGSDTLVFEVSEILSMEATHRTDYAKLGLVLMPGDVIKITTQNPTTYGSFDYHIFVAMTLYNL